jgi:hypothetical protein
MSLASHIVADYFSRANLGFFVKSLGVCVCVCARARHFADSLFTSNVCYILARKRHVALNALNAQKLRFSRHKLTVPYQL